MFRNVEMSQSGNTSLHPPEKSVWLRCDFTARRPAFRRPKQRSSKNSKLVALRVARGQAPLFEWRQEDRRKVTIAEGQGPACISSIGLPVQVLAASFPGAVCVKILCLTAGYCTSSWLQRSNKSSKRDSRANAKAI